MKEAALGFRTYQIPESISARICELTLKHWKIDLNSEKLQHRVIEAILRMSDFYAESPLERTPWDEDWCQLAQLVYFLPLNFLRNLAVIEEGRRLGFFEGLTEALDFGAGLGAASLALKEFFPKFEVFDEEASPQANLLRRDLIQNPNRKKQSELLICSFSLTEDNHDLKLRQFSNLLIIEPSTQDDARRLQELRQTLIEQGFSIWAPCTHQKRCPLLIHNQKDWCHDRIHFKRPDWFLRIEKNLPMKNENLTFSYLLASQRPAPDLLGRARMTGDFLREKGKSRQLFCRGEDREFLSMLSRDGELPEYSRGALIEVPKDGTPIGSEYRIKPIKV